MPDWHSLGKHRYYLRGDVIFLETHGDLVLDETQALFLLLTELNREFDASSMIVDARQGAGMSAEARRFSGEWQRVHILRGLTVVFGASLLTRTTALLVTNVVRLLTRRP